MYQKDKGKINNNNNPSIEIYINKIKNAIAFEVKIGYYLELLISETMKLLGSTKRKTVKDDISFRNC